MIPWEGVPYLSALEMWSRQGAIQIHVYLYLYVYHCGRFHWPVSYYTSGEKPTKSGGRGTGSYETPEHLNLLPKLVCQDLAPGNFRPQTWNSAYTYGWWDACVTSRGRPSHHRLPCSIIEQRISQSSLFASSIEESAVETICVQAVRPSVRCTFS